MGSRIIVWVILFFRFYHFRLRIILGTVLARFLFQLFVSRDVLETFLDFTESCELRRNSPNFESELMILFSVRLSFSEVLLVTLPSISSKTWVMHSPFTLETFMSRDGPALGCSFWLSWFTAANFFYFCKFVMMENEKVVTFSLQGNKGERSLLRESYPTTQIAAQNLLYVISRYFEGEKPWLSLETHSWEDQTDNAIMFGLFAFSSSNNTF